MIGEVLGADSALQPRRSSRNIEGNFRKLIFYQIRRQKKREMRNITFSPMEKESWRDMEKS